MPRATRAAARAGVIHVDDPDIAVGQVEASLERPPLEEIQGNDRDLATTDLNSKATDSPKKGRSKPKKIRVGKKTTNRAQQNGVPEAQHPQNTGIDLVSNTAQHITTEDLTNEEYKDHQNINCMFLNHANGFSNLRSVEQLKIQRDQPETDMPSEALPTPKDLTELNGKEVAGPPKSPLKTHTYTSTMGCEETISSQITQIAASGTSPREPENIKQSRDVCSIDKDQAQPTVAHLVGGISNITDGPVQQTPPKLSSPAQVQKRPEDSIEAIDALEDALEEIGKEITVLEGSSHPENDSSGDNGPKSRVHLSTAPGAKKGASRSVTSNSKLTGSKTVKTRHMKTASTPEARIVNKKSVPATADVNKIANFEAKEASFKNQTEPSKRRPVSLSFPTPAPPPRSRKPPTRPTFQLPGEAVAAKLKAQREERLQREEADEQKKREFKARPVRKSATPAISVKPTAASRARISAAHQRASNAGGESMRRESVVTKPRAPLEKGPTVKPTPAIAKSEPRHPVKDAKARTSVSTSKPSNRGMTSAPTTSNERTGSSSAAATATTGGSRNSAVTASDIVQQRQKARAIFARDRRENDEREASRRFKEDAAKKARAEAAERGRVASRKWAERQQAKQMEGLMARKGSVAGGGGGGTGDESGGNAERGLNGIVSA